jgi:hypothetical protein
MAQKIVPHEPATAVDVALTKPLDPLGSHHLRPPGGPTRQVLTTLRVETLAWSQLES